MTSIIEYEVCFYWAYFEYHISRNISDSCCVGVRHTCYCTLYHRENYISTKTRLHEPKQNKVQYQKHNSSIKTVTKSLKGKIKNYSVSLEEIKLPLTLLSNYAMHQKLLLHDQK